VPAVGQGGQNVLALDEAQTAGINDVEQGICLGMAGCRLQLNSYDRIFLAAGEYTLLVSGYHYFFN